MKRALESGAREDEREPLPPASGAPSETVVAHEVINLVSSQSQQSQQSSPIHMYEVPHRGDGGGAGPSASSVIERLEAELGYLAPAQKVMLAKLPSSTLTGLQKGSITLADVEVWVAHEKGLECQEEGAAELAVAQAAAEAADQAEVAEMQLLDQKLKACALAPPPAEQGEVDARHFVQNRLDGNGRLLPQTTWRWEAGAWRADGPPLHDKEFLRVCFISDTHGCHDMLQKWFDEHPEAMEADVLLMCGDNWEHEGESQAEAGPSLLSGQEYKGQVFKRNLADWLLRLPHRYKMCISGNHDSPFLFCEAAALRGVEAPDAGVSGRAYLKRRGGPCLYLQDENAVIPMADCRSLIIHGLPWQTDIGGLFQYHLGEYIFTGDANGVPHGYKLPGMKPNNVGPLISGSWGPGDGAHIVFSHGAAKYILDTVTGGFKSSGETSAQAATSKTQRKPCGCGLLLGKLRRVKPLVFAHGHVHAEQGLPWLEWNRGHKNKDAKNWRAAGKRVLERNAKKKAEGRTDFERYPDVPPSAGGLRGPLRVVRGHDLSQVHAGAPMKDLGPGDEVRKQLEADFANTLFVNAANLNATISMHQHGLYVNSETKQLKLMESEVEASSRLRALRPPIVVDVYPERPGEPRARGRAELIPLGITRFPEER